jgi:hypothetical protein
MQQVKFRIGSQRGRLPARIELAEVARGNNRCCRSLRDSGQFGRTAVFRRGTAQSWCGFGASRRERAGAVKTYGFLLRGACLPCRNFIPCAAFLRAVRVTSIRSFGFINDVVRSAWGNGGWYAAMSIHIERLLLGYFLISGADLFPRQHC